MTSRPALVGVSGAIAALRDEVVFAAASDARVLITGDTGTGKEVVAQLIHAHSARGARRRLISLNCAGLPETLLESELFGHERGSFTGADSQRLGVLGNADGGTVFLDEVGELSPRMQSLLLRFLDNGEIQRVGAQGMTRVDVRVIAATNVNLVESAESGAFRLDLYYRLNVLRLETTALRDRREDIPLLLQHFLGLYAGLSLVPVPSLTESAMDRLVRYDWPGNVRELRNLAERLVAGRPVRPVEVSDFSDDLTAASSMMDSRSPEQPPATVALDVLYRRMTTAGESFWSVIHPLFMARDLTRTDLRSVITAGLKAVHGNYRALVRMFNMEPKDYKRFLSFLRKHGCLLDYRSFRTL